MLPTARFADGAHQAARGRLWLKRLALLALRLATVALLVVALAGPFLGRPRHGTGDAWVLCLDASPSMGAKTDGGTRFDRARRRLAEVVSALPDDAPVTLVVTGRRPSPGTAAKAGDALQGLAEPSWAGEPLGRMVARALAAGRDAPSPLGHVVIATDATAWALRDVAAGKFADLAAEVTILPAGGPARNVWLGSPAVRVTEAPRGRSLDVRVDVRGAGAKPPAVLLELAGASDRHTAHVDAGAAAATFAVPVAGIGPWQGKVFVETDDALASDNVRYFTVAARAPVRVLVVDAADESDVRVRSADLVAATFGGDTPVPKQVRRLRAAEADAGALEGADVVFWVGSAGPADAARAEALAGHGGVVWVPADAVPPDAALARALGGEFGPARDVPDGATIDPAGYASDLLAAFEGGTSGDLGAPVFRRRLDLGPGGDGASVDFRDGRAALRVRRAGPGRRAILAAGPSPTWGDLAGRVEFVVLLHSLAEALAPAAGPRWANLTIGRGANLPIRGYKAVPGNYAEASETAEKGYYSVNLDPSATADLGPEADRLASAFGAGRASVVSGDFSPKTSISAPSGASRTDLAPYAIVALAGVLAAESLLSHAQSATGRSRP